LGFEYDGYFRVKFRHDGPDLIYVHLANLDCYAAGGVSIQRSYASVGSLLDGLLGLYDKIPYPVNHFAVG